MRYTNNAIYTVIRAAALSVASTTNVTQTYTPTPSKFPCVFAREIGHFTPEQAATFANAQDISECTWEVQVLSDLKTGAKEQAYKLMGSIKDALRGLYFLETFEAPLDGVTTHYTLVARFRRVIGSGDEFPNT